MQCLCNSAAFLMYALQQHLYHMEPLVYFVFIFVDEIHDFLTVSKTKDTPYQLTNHKIAQISHFVNTNTTCLAKTTILTSPFPHSHDISESLPSPFHSHILVRLRSPPTHMNAYKYNACKSTRSPPTSVALGVACLDPTRKYRVTAHQPNTNTTQPN